MGGSNKPGSIHQEAGSGEKSEQWWSKKGRQVGFVPCICENDGHRDQVVLETRAGAAASQDSFEKQIFRWEEYGSQIQRKHLRATAYGRETWRGMRTGKVASASTLDTLPPVLSVLHIPTSEPPTRAALDMLFI